MQDGEERKNNNPSYDSLTKIKGGLFKSIKKKQDGLVNCCKQYKFVREFDTLDFNNRMNSLGITHLVLNRKYNLTGMFLRDIKNPIKWGANTVFGIIGKTGSGKSELAQVIYLYSKDANMEFKHRDINFHLDWTMSDLQKTLLNLKKGDVVMKDESPVSMGKGSRKEKWAIENVLSVIRKFENTFIFVDPLNIHIKLCDIYFESAGMDLVNRINRFMVLNKYNMYLGHIIVALHDNEELRKWYEQEKDNFILRTLKEGGRFKAEKVDQELEKEEEKEVFLEEIEFLKSNYKSRNKARDISIYILRKQGFTFSEIGSLVGDLKRHSIANIYYTISDVLNSK